MHRLLWYYPAMKALKLADELYGLLYDVVFDSCRRIGVTGG